MTADAMAALMARAMPDARPWSATEFADLIARPGAIVVDTENGFVIGQVTPDEAEVFMVLTDPAKRRLGLARANLSAFHEAARLAGAGRVILDVAADNDAALGLYAALGYRQIAERKAYYARTDGTRISALILEIGL